MAMDTKTAVIIFMLALSGGCTLPDERARHDRLQTGQPQDRIQAMVEAVDADDQQAVPYIVECLTCDESDVRLFAYSSLQRLTGQTMGYDPYAPPRQRQEAFERWRRWLAAGRPAAPAERNDASIGIEEGAALWSK